MALDISTLPEEARTLIAAQAATIARQRTELSERRDQLARLQAQLAKLRRMHFGRASERLHAEITQLELALVKLEEQDTARPEEPVTPPTTAGADVLKPARRPLPDHLPRDVVTHATACACPHCGGQLRRLGRT